MIHTEGKLWTLAALNAVYCVVQLGVSLKFESLALLSDAFHNISDVAAIVLAVFVHRLQKVKRSFQSIARQSPGDRCESHLMRLIEKRLSTMRTRKMSLSMTSYDAVG
jgi:cell division protein ZapA (FtsZ GTPase activity inhibitor)